MPNHFLDSDDDEHFSDIDFEIQIVVSSESESFVSTSDELIRSTSDSDSDDFDDLSFSSLLPAKSNNFLDSSRECKIVECLSSYSDDNECDAIDTNIPEPDPLYEYTEMEKEHPNSSELEDFEETES